MKPRQVMPMVCPMCKAEYYTWEGYGLHLDECRDDWRMTLNHRETTRCVYCIKRKATIWTGHVLKSKEKILAGWCSKCIEKARTGGFSGHWKLSMGVM